MYQKVVYAAAVVLLAVIEAPTLQAVGTVKKVERGGGQAVDNSGRESVGLKPVSDMTAEDAYKGETGGLYGDGRNEPPAPHAAAAAKETAKIVPLDAEGKPSASGKIVLVSISMSNATQEFSFFKRVADTDLRKSPRLAIVDCAQGGQAMAEWAPAKGAPWKESMRRLTQAGVSPNQVQVAWIKLANKGPSGELWEHGGKLRDDTLAVLQNAKAVFPNLRIAYLGSRTYGGYSGGRLNPEPYAYESGFAARRLILDQIGGDAELNYDADRGLVKSPLLLWGPYLWADGATPRKSDGLVWARNDFGPDAIHPSESGKKKVSDQLLKFFTTDHDAKTWFVE